MLFVLLAFTFATSQELNEEDIYEVYVKQSGNDTNTGTEIGQEKKSLKSAYDLLRKNHSCNIYVVNSATALKAEAISIGSGYGITMEGVDSKGTKNEIVAINCNVHPGNDLFSCSWDVEFKYLAFLFPITLNKENVPQGIFSLIRGGEELTINNCQFIRPLSYETKIHLNFVRMHNGILIMENVECTDDDDIAIFDNTLFGINQKVTVSMNNVTLKKISSNIEIVNIIGSHYEADVTLNGSTFTECQSSRGSVVFFYSEHHKSKFTVADGGVTTFTSCNSGYAGGIYLNMTGITSASQLKWPTDGKNLVFQNCSRGKGESKRNTGLAIRTKNEFILKDIADAMKASFAADFTRKDNSWNVVGYDEENKMEYDFTSKYFDPPPPKPDNMTRAFVKKDCYGNGVSVESAINSLNDAYEYLTKSGACFVDIVRTDDPIKAEEITFDVDSGITIEGVNDNGEGNTEASISCDVSVSSILFSCQKIVEFKYLAFQFSSTEKNWDSLISAGSGSISLKISTCRFVRIGSQTQEGMNSNADGNSSIGKHLVFVTTGTVEMDTVKCTDETSFVSFSRFPFDFDGASEVSLNGVEINKLNLEVGPAINIDLNGNSDGKISVEGVKVQEIYAEFGNVAGLRIKCFYNESNISLGRTRKCTFKSCSSSNGIAGAICIDMFKAVSNLKLPAANNLEIDSSNKAGSKTTSMFISALDFKEFCEQENAFEFANDFDDSTVGWIVAAISSTSEPEDVYEKYIKGKKKKPIDNPEEDQTKDEKKTSTGVIVVAIVVPIVVVVVVVVIVIVIVVVRKKRSKN
ncbi:uncharacterized protein MONOS_10379 [Monocercomonoides exilis]|uniref:uncharacterized protein n=1 Tax=Monocercomonoides exilis TaxID=2049356 RepID=UPI003559565C|nr:hypothetical protein MONOS_10379 [Monocercomonoides exilis]|eukprot:MONOS_10379.1-p1 / transcript=MONOS_10379.1 / gene=MONOS_10379 / organism=Monocercomonoides_exilis_PA203 / gene_product=unspecified product / transcript_product=unspecified product / location=Mono_scaffold00469:33764-36178(+) / protein_length=804 / sequence_SO=supercontig / SO=protein_coding / is_pseudo=false